MQRFSSVPMPSMEVRTTSPSVRKTPLRNPTPSGVPVKIKSPVVKVTKREINAMSFGILKIKLEVRSCWRSSPFTLVWSSRSAGSGKLSGETRTGPVGPNESMDFPSVNCAGMFMNWAPRSEKSWPTVNPTTCSHAWFSSMSLPPGPITTTSSPS